MPPLGNTVRFVGGEQRDATLLMHASKEIEEAVDHQSPGGDIQQLQIAPPRHDQTIACCAPRNSA